jgi:hypothetical protein
VVFEGFELAFGVGVVVAGVGSVEASSESESGEELCDGGGGHGGAAVGVDGELSGLDALVSGGFLDEELGEFSGFSGVEEPADDVAAEDVDDDVELEVEPFWGAFESGDVPAPDLVGGGGEEFGFGALGVVSEVASFADFLVFVEDAVHGSG